MHRCGACAARRPPLPLWPRMVHVRHGAHFACMQLCRLRDSRPLAFRRHIPHRICGFRKDEGEKRMEESAYLRLGRFSYGTAVVLPHPECPLQNCAGSLRFSAAPRMGVSRCAHPPNVFWGTTESRALDRITWRRTEFSTAGQNLGRTASAWRCIRIASARMQFCLCSVLTEKRQNNSGIKTAPGNKSLTSKNAKP